MTTRELEKTYAGKHIAGQLMRSATSSGANYEEARGTESRADFVHKMQVVLKELRESLYWLRLTEKSSLISGDKSKKLLKEASELCNIIGRSIVTAKKNALKKEG
jgi:four helix bundle protein